MVSPRWPGYSLHQLLQVSCLAQSRLLSLGTLAMPGADGPSRQGGRGTWQRELPKAITTKGMGPLMRPSPAQKGCNGQEKQMTSFIHAWSFFFCIRAQKRLVKHLAPVFRASAAGKFPLPIFQSASCHYSILRLKLFSSPSVNFIVSFLRATQGIVLCFWFQKHNLQKAKVK